MKPIDRLRTTALNRITTERPNLPYPESFVHRYVTNTANGLTRCVIDWINFNGGFARRVSVTGKMVDGTKVVTDVMGGRRIVGSVSYQKSSMVRGSADISAVINGKSIEIEIKIKRDIQSDKQKEYQANIQKAGGTYIVVKTFEEFLNWWDSRPVEGVQTELFTNTK
jgi:hypothetical protein